VAAGGVASHQPTGPLPLMLRWMGARRLRP
jgi:hypothetical protein